MEQKAIISRSINWKYCTVTKSLSRAAIGTREKSAETERSQCSKEKKKEKLSEEIKKENDCSVNCNLMYELLHKNKEGGIKQPKIEKAVEGLGEGLCPTKAFEC